MKYLILNLLLLSSCITPLRYNNLNRGDFCKKKASEQICILVDFTSDTKKTYIDGKDVSIAQACVRCFHRKTNSVEHPVLVYDEKLEHIWVDELDKVEVFHYVKTEKITN